MERKPIIDDFIGGTIEEADYQVSLWGTEDRESKSHIDYFWLVGYLAGKALASAIQGDTDKARHHTISTAAVLLHWHGKISGEITSVRFEPGSRDAKRLGDTLTD
jgi:hypothetical protein